MTRLAAIFGMVLWLASPGELRAERTSTRLTPKKTLFAAARKSGSRPS